MGTFIFEISIDRWSYFRFGILGFTFYSLMGAYSLFFSALHAEGELTLTFAAGLTLIFYALDVTGGLSDQLSWVRRLSLFQCYQPQEILEGSMDPMGRIIGLGIGTLILFYLAMKVFDGKDLAL